MTPFVVCGAELGLIVGVYFLLPRRHPRHLVRRVHVERVGFWLKPRNLPLNLMGLVYQVSDSFSGDEDPSYTVVAARLEVAQSVAR